MPIVKGIDDVVRRKAVVMIQVNGENIRFKSYETCSQYLTRHGARLSANSIKLKESNGEMFRYVDNISGRVCEVFFDEAY